SDQHRGWFQSSMLLSLAGNGAAPYKTVLTHGFMVKVKADDPNKTKQKVSKSDQNKYEKPETAERYIKDFGADVVRLWVASQDYRSDIMVGDDRVIKVAETYRAIRNCLRYQLSNLYDFNPAKDTVADDQLTGLDRWILGEFAKLQEAVLAAYNAYEFHVVYQKLSQFVAVELSSVYHDVIKDRLYTDPANSLRRRSSQTALHRIVTGLCQMLAPLLAYTADEAWEFIPGKQGTSVHASDWNNCPDLKKTQVEQNYWTELFDIRAKVLPSIEEVRQAKIVGKSLDAKVVITWKEPENKMVAALNSIITTHQVDHGIKSGLSPKEEDLKELLNVSQIELINYQSGAHFSAKVEKAFGQKCERCWHWENDIGQNAEHTTLCGRCVEAVKVSLSGKA
ncbi:MAG: class I tRNA ligase family protein, partial [Verrucomicrobiota bacterium]